MATEVTGKLLAIKCDVRQEDEIKAAFKKAVEVFGSVEVCINNAGLSHSALLLSGSTGEWRDMLEVSNNTNFFARLKYEFKFNKERNRTLCCIVFYIISCSYFNRLQYSVIVS